jgi:hypothetical protein
MERHLATPDGRRGCASRHPPVPSWTECRRPGHGPPKATELPSISLRDAALAPRNAEGDEPRASPNTGLDTRPAAATQCGRRIWPDAWRTGIHIDAMPVTGCRRAISVGDVRARSRFVVNARQMRPHPLTPD